MMKVTGGVNRMIMGRRLRRLGFGKWKERVQCVSGQEVRLCWRKKEKRKEDGLKRKSTKTEKRKTIFQRDRRREETRLRGEEKVQLHQKERVKERQPHHWQKRRTTTPVLAWERHHWGSDNLIILGSEGARWEEVQRRKKE